MRWQSKISRVDLQVSLLAAAFVSVAMLCVYAFAYTLAHRDMIHTLSERSARIYDYVKDAIDVSTFSEIRSKADQGNPSYLSVKKVLKDAKDSTGVMYLYTARKREDGAFIYVVDGLDRESPDFRNAGDLIEEEIWHDMDRALQGEIVLPDEIKETSWGHIFVTYYPIYDRGEVVGVLGIEFEAQHQYETFRLLRLGTPLIALATIVAAVLIAVRLFRRISNPSFKDLATMDYLTKQKNRNAFEIDLGNFDNYKGGKPAAALVSVDLDGLKQINDVAGHHEGDRYICAASDLLARNLPPDGVLYRIGGDEFAVLLLDYGGAIESKLSEYLARLAAACEAEQAVQISVGFALRDQAQDERLFETLRRADREMYKNKRNRKRRAAALAAEEER